MFFFKYRPGAHVEGLCGGGAKMGFINHFGGRGDFSFLGGKGNRVCDTKTKEL